MDGLKARLSFDAVAYDYDDEYLTIDTDTHTININNVSRLFGVQYDGNSKLIKFRIRNQLSEIQKMQDSIVYINWIDQRGVKGQSIAINKTINNDTCEFAWKVPFDALKNSGVLHFAMSAVITENGSSVINQKWSTQIASVITPDGIYIKSYTPSSEEEDRIAQIYNELSKMINKQNDNLQSQVNSLNEALVEQDSNNRGINLLKFVKWTDGKYIYTTGVASDNTDYSYTELMKCVPNEEYSINVNKSNAFINFYNINREHISGIYKEKGKHIIETPESAYYITYSCYTTDKYRDIILNTNPLITKKDSYDIISGFNADIINNSGWKRGYYLSADNGTEIANSGLSHTIDYSLCGSGNTYACPLFTDTVYVCFYDKNKNFISGTTDKVFITPDNCTYLRLSTISDHEEYMYLINSFNTKEISISNGDDIQKAINIANKFNIPLIVNGGTYDISNIGGIGLSVKCNIIGIGNPVIKADLAVYNENFSIFNFDLTARKNVKIDGLHLIANNCRYAIHCEMGGNKKFSENEAYYTHKIINCIIDVNDDKRCIGCGLGDNGYLLIDNCQLKTNNGDYAIAIHSGYNGQRKDTKAVVTNCYMNKTVQAQSINSGDSGYMDTILVNNCSMESEPILETTETQNVTLLKWNNNIRN